MLVKVLGSFEMLHAGGVYTPSAPKVRQVLALLALRAGQVVTLDALIEELWNVGPPKSAVTTVQTYIYQLRKTFEQINGCGPAMPPLRSCSPGYTLDIGDGVLDANTFDTLAERARSQLEEGHTRQAAATSREALALWTGPALSNVVCGPLLCGYAARLEELRMTVLSLRISADAQLGRHRELVPELKELVIRHPLNEWLHAQLIIALNIIGRRGEALLAYHSLRSVLNLELGLDPSFQLQEIHQAILTADGSAEGPLELQVLPL